jgi:hypothetical protein
MQLTGPQLTETLKAHNGAVEVRNAQSFRVGEVSTAKALELVAGGRFIGIGNRRRILFLRPQLQPQVAGWRGSSLAQTQRIRNERGEIIAPDFALEFKPLVYQQPQG